MSFETFLARRVLDLRCPREKKFRPIAPEGNSPICAGSKGDADSIF
jgi:hypothetical protein